MTEPLHDQAARDRFRIELDASFCVSAGAGVGKTSAIVERIAELARRTPEQLPRLVVVTYTKAAAEQLRVRARRLLLRERAGADLLPRFRQAFFGTIHSFCLKLVREFGSELGIAPDVDLLEEDEELWARYCESPALDAVPMDREALGAVTRFLSFDELLQLARKIEPGQAERMLAADLREQMPPLDFTAALSDDGGRGKETTQGHQEMLRRFLADFSEGAGFLRIPDFTGGGKSFLTKYKAGIYPFAAWLDRQAARLAAGIALGYRDFRRELRLMTYADQIAWCRRLIEDRAILAELRARDWIVLLDEAQDTDAAMFSILTEVTRPPGAALGEWPEKRAAPGPRAGRFCFVGDEQQSIYASRASLGVYAKYIEAYVAGLGGERLEFSVTMRCPVRVIETVNAIFYKESRLSQTHFAFRELHAKPGCDDGAAWVLPIEPPAGETSGVDAEFEEECRQVAAFLKDFGPSGLGVEQWSDVAILCPRNGWLAAAEEILVKAGLPSRLISQQRIQLEQPGRSWPAALLHVIANPWDRFELLGVLREIFAVSDVELADAQMENKPFTFWSEVGLSPRLAAALKMLRELHGCAPPGGGMSVGRYVDHVLEATRLGARLAATGEGAGALAQLRLEALRAEIAGAPFRNWVAQLVRNLQRPAEQTGGTGAGIQLLTCQKAKGQEWPVVIPLGFARSIRLPRAEYPRIEESAGAIAVHVSKVTVNEEEKAARELARLEELTRLFYVTVTRAKSLLILPDSVRLYKPSKDSFQTLSKWEWPAWENLFEKPRRLGSAG